MAVNNRVIETSEGGESHKSRFEKHIVDFVSSTKTSMEAARHCAEAALLHFENFDDVTLLQRFHDAMPLNYSRRQAFIRWAGDHSPLTSKAGKFSKNKKPDARKFDTKKALSEPFWEYAPEAKLLYYTASTIMEEVERLVKKFTDTSKKDNVTVSDDPITAAALMSLSNYRTSLYRDISTAKAQAAAPAAN